METSMSGTATGRDQDLDLLSRQVTLSSRVGIPMFAGMAAMVYRDHGTAELFHVWTRMMGGAQSALLRDGMRKLGISSDEPPAVQVGKYHYFSNILGGLILEYIEESPQKVWLRYRGPYQMMPSIAAIAFPPTIRRHQFSTWHARNRHFLGYPRLGWVYTKTTLEGDPYDEGYFIEYDHDINDVEADGSEVVRNTPEFDLSTAPQLDPVAWPMVRQLKARRNYALGYVGTTTRALTAMYGELEASHMIDKTVRIIATQLGREWIRDLQIEGTNLDAAVALTTGLLNALGQEYTLVPKGDRHVRIVVRPSRPFDALTFELRTAFSSLFQTCIRHMSGRIRCTLLNEGENDVYDLEETDSWLW